MVGTRLEGSQAEVFVTLRQKVAIQDDFLRAFRAALAAMNAVLPALLGAGVIQPGTARHRSGDVGLLDPRQNFPVEAIFGFGHGLHSGRGVAVLRLQIFDRLGQAAVAQPRVLVHAGVIHRLGNRAGGRGKQLTWGGHVHLAIVA